MSFYTHYISVSEAQGDYITLSVHVCVRTRYMHIISSCLWFLCTAAFTEWSIERQVLHSQCKRLEAQNYNLTRTAEQLSLTMGVSICLFASWFLVDLCQCHVSVPILPVQEVSGM